MKMIQVLLWSLASLQAISQPSAPLFPPVAYPQNYFRDPLDIPMHLAANFGELRPNHYHMGLDIRTAHRENLPVHAAADGYIARVQIEPFGFGQAIYIRHPNGYTTVYGHLNHFTAALAAYVQEQQYRQQSWQVDLAIPPALFPVKKGDLIAWSGNTGGSQGPHLHFEIRLTAGDINLNPLLFGLPVPDAVPPSILRLAWYDRTQGIYEQTPHILPVHKDAAGPRISVRSPIASAATTAAWSVTPGILTVPTNRISFGISAFDAQSGSANPNGIYQAILYEDGRAVIGFEMDHISYDNTRNINAHIDYKTRETGGPFLQLLSFSPGYPFPSIYRVPGTPYGTDPAADSASQPTGVSAQARVPNGVLDLSDGRLHDIRIEARDTRGNTSALSFRVRYSAAPGLAPAGGAGGKRFYPGMLDGIETDDCAFYLGEKSLYDSAVIGLSIAGYPGSGLSFPGGVSPVYAIGAPYIPLLDPVLVRLRYPGKGQAVPPGDSAAAVAAPGAGGIPMDKLVMVCFHGADRDVRRPEWKDGWASARFREFGNFQLVCDTVPPVITPAGPLEGADLSHAGGIAVHVKDNLGALRGVRAELDGGWLCFTNDKALAYIYTFDEHCPAGPHVLKIEAEDVAGNRTVREYHFTR